MFDLVSIARDIFALLAWFGAMMAGSRLLGKSKSGTLFVGIGPEIFDLHLNRFVIGST